ncbi:hypothetical protein PIB30_028605 [Stylosanthes scabra]|uniref:DUF674 family protein n=1 Tax=Stylosanthes scabra TaxID=79078 RepID=A0ABU6X8M4_9FABA|nr:hypothetical protein [Stylosanthes scabra]
MAATQTEEEVLLRFVVNQEKTQVLYAEAGKDFVDALFSLLTLPLGTIVRLFKEDSVAKSIEIGCLHSLYNSVVKLDEKCFSTKACREMLLHPRRSAETYCNGMKLNIDDPTNYFLCQDYECRTGRNSKPILSTIRNRACSNCNKLLNYQVHLQEKSLGGEGHGFSNGKMTFIITDCLRVIPNSLVASLNLLKEFGIHDIRSVHKMSTAITKEEVLDILFCSLTTKNCLTSFISSYCSMSSLISIFNPDLNSFTDCDVDDGEHINVKLIRKKSTGRILFAEGGEDFANFILGFLAIPLGGVVRMLKGTSCVGNLDELYKSAVDLDKNYFLCKRKRVKKMIVDPQIAPHFTTKYHLLPINESPAKKYYFHEACGRSDLVTTYHCTTDGVKRQRCELMDFMDPKIPYEDGFVEGPRLYTVADDLSVKAMSSTSAMSMLVGEFDTPLSDLEEVEASIGIMEGLNILKASLLTGAALTNGFSHLFSSQEEQVESDDENSISNTGVKLPDI